MLLHGVREEVVAMAGAAAEHTGLILVLVVFDPVGALLFPQEPLGFHPDPCWLYFGYGVVVV